MWRAHTPTCTSSQVSRLLLQHLFACPFVARYAMATHLVCPAWLERSTMSTHLCSIHSSHLSALSTHPASGAGPSGAAAEHRRQMRRALFVFAKLNPGLRYVQVRWGKKVQRWGWVTGFVRVVLAPAALV